MHRAIFIVVFIAASGCSRDEVDEGGGGAAPAPGDAAVPDADDAPANLDMTVDAAPAGAVDVGAGGSESADSASPAPDAAPPDEDAAVEPPCTPTPEICDGLDNNCNGAVDEDVVDDEGPCREGVGACRNDGEYRCVGGELICNVQGLDDTPERCDSVDNDCDGQLDEMSCPADEFCDGRSCVGECVPRAEECDGVDNDCDGRADEDLTRLCGSSTGECSRGNERCVTGEWGACDGQVAVDERCDGRDNDCDRATDEDTCDAGEVCDEGACVPEVEPCDVVYRFSNAVNSDTRTRCYSGGDNSHGAGNLELCLELERVADGPTFRGRVCKGDDEGVFANATVAVEIRGTNPEYGLRRLFRDLSERVNGVRCTDWQDLDLAYIEGDRVLSDAIVGYLVSPHDGADDRAVPLRAVEGEALDFRSGNVNVERVCD